LTEPTKAHPAAGQMTIEEAIAAAAGSEDDGALRLPMPESTRWEIFDRFFGAAVQGCYRLAHIIGIPDSGSRRAKKRLKEIDHAIRALEKLRTELREKFNLPI
jgi:hypothetical protein